MGADLITWIVKGPAELDEKKIDEAARVGHYTLSTSKFPEDVDEFETENYEGWDYLSCRDVASDLVEAWNQGFRDVNFRIDPDDEGVKIVVAGEMSWGDEPQGYGYQALKHAYNLGMWETFGIR